MEVLRILFHIKGGRIQKSACVVLTQMIHPPHLAAMLLIVSYKPQQSDFITVYTHFKKYVILEI